jgi:hypothetical protein
MPYSLNNLLEGLNDSRVPIASQGAEEYARTMGLIRPQRFDSVVVNPDQKRAVTQEYLAAPLYDKEAEPHYKALAEETKRQYDFMARPRSRGGLGIDLIVGKADPYTKPSADGLRDIPDPAAMMRDVRENNRLEIRPSSIDDPHPYFTDDENDMFRGVHDFFGHAATGRGFDQSGEDAAYLSHSAMFSPTARLAMATETRGQNMTNNSGLIPRNPDGTPGFVPNKAVIIPSTQLVFPWRGRRSEFQSAALKARLAHERAFGPIVGN